VTGAGGFVGSWIVKYLVDRGKEAIGLLHDSDPKCPLRLQGLQDSIVIVQGDICDKELLSRVIAEFDINLIIHAAAQAMVKVGSVIPYETYRVNVLGTAAVLEVARAFKDRISLFHYVSTDKVYGSTSNTTPFREDTPFVPLDPYSASKAAADQMCQIYIKQIPILITRNCNIYGPFDIHHRVVPNTIRSCMRGEKPVHYPKSNDKKQYMHVEDAVLAWMRLIDERKTGAYNVAYGELVGQEIVPMVASMFNIDAIPDYSQDKTSGTTQFISTERYVRDLGPIHARSLKEGLAQTVQWWKANQHLVT